MLSPRRLAVSSLAPLALALGTILGFTREASAAQSLTIDTTQKIGADLFVDELTITETGVLLVKSKRAMATGALHIRARKITVAKNGVISATGAGFTGANGADGNAEPNSLGGGKISPVQGEPGGGGGYLQPGASGADKDCMLLPGAKGGSALKTAPTSALPLFGSAGGAANVTSTASAGGDGGGEIFLEAAEIILDGTIEARGESPAAVAGVARGGGSGGFISIITPKLSGIGQITAAGGNGSVGDGVVPTIPANNGGGGAGGLVFLRTTKFTAAIQAMIHVEGGASGGCGKLAGDGAIEADPDDATFCVDLDGDGAKAVECGGTDCDDTEATIHPGAKEICNAVDDNCDGKNNEGANICAPGTTCDMTELKCVAVAVPDAGADSGPPVDVGARPDHLAFESGCALGDGDGGGLGALATAALGLTALATRRRRAARRDDPRR